MLTIFLFSFFIAIFASAFCSLMEAALYSIPTPYVNDLANQGKKSGKILKDFKENMSIPISGILIFNTISNTAGASVTGWAAGQLYGSTFIVFFSIVFTLLILYVSEIIPKLIGVTYCKQIAPIISYPLSFILKIVKPLLFFSNWISRLVQSKDDEPVVSTSEIVSMAELGEEEGSLDELEGSIIRNIIGLDRVFVKDVLTPRVVVFRLDEDTKISAIKDTIFSWNHTRVPLYKSDNEDILTSYVTQRDIFKSILEGQDKSLKEISRPIETVPELMRADKLLLRFFEKREHICAVVDEHGSLAGIITLEDILEEIIGKEIVDEYDAVKDLRRYARNSMKRKEIKNLS